MIENKICMQCGKEFSKPPYCGNQRWDDRKYCSQKCYHENRMGKSSWNKGIPSSESHKQNQSIAQKGINTWSKGAHCSEETKKKISIIKMGKYPSEETKQKMRKNHPHLQGKDHPAFGRGGNKHPLYGKYGESSPKWKGGKKVSQLKHDQKRRLLGFILLNNPEQSDWVGHHLDYNYIIFIPEELHKSIWHSVTKDINMDVINDKVCEWFMEYYFGGTC